LFDFRFNPISRRKTVIQDAFVAARFNPLFVVTAGKFKEPFGLERLQCRRTIGSRTGYPAICPNRDLGLQVSGTYAFASARDLPSWLVQRVSDGTSTDANATPDVDNNDTRIGWREFSRSRSKRPTWRL